MRKVTVVIKDNNDYIACKDFSYEVNDIIQIASELASTLKEYSVEEVIVEQGRELLKEVPCRMPDEDLRITYIVSSSKSVDTIINNLLVNVKYNDIVIKKEHLDKCTVDEFIKYITDLMDTYNIVEYWVNGSLVEEFPAEMSNTVLDIYVTEEVGLDMGTFIETIDSASVNIINSYIAIRDEYDEVIEEIEVHEESGNSVKEILNKVTDNKYSITSYTIDGTENGNRIEFGIINVKICEETYNRELTQRVNEIGEGMTQEQYNRLILILFQILFLLMPHLRKDDKEGKHSSI